MKFFDHSRAFVAAHGVGLAQGAMEQAINYVKKRKQFGKTIASFQVTQFKIAEMATLIETARSCIRPAGISTGGMRIPSCRPWQNGGPAMWRSGLWTKHFNFTADMATSMIIRSSASTGPPRLLEIYEGTKEIDRR